MLQGFICPPAHLHSWLQLISHPLPRFGRPAAQRDVSTRMRQRTNRLHTDARVAACGQAGGGQATVCAKHRGGGGSGRAAAEAAGGPGPRSACSGAFIEITCDNCYLPAQGHAAQGVQRCGTVAERRGHGARGCVCTLDREVGDAKDNAWLCKPCSEMLCAALLRDGPFDSSTLRPRALQRPGRSPVAIGLKRRSPCSASARLSLATRLLAGRRPPSTMSQQALDELALLVVHNLPQALFVALVVFVVALVLKDFINGMARRPFLNPDKCARGWGDEMRSAAPPPPVPPPMPPPARRRCTTPLPPSSAHRSLLRLSCLPSARWQPLTLVDIKTLSHNTRRYRFALPHQEQELGLPLGQHISIKASDAEGRDVMRCAGLVRLLSAAVLCLLP